MTRRIVDKLLLVAGLAVPGGPVLIGQAQSHAVFDVASIKANTTVNSPGWTRFDPAGVNIRRASLLAVIATAYRIHVSLVSAEPRLQELLASRYDIVAKAEHEVSRDQLRTMLQTLLADRFRLALHRESKVQPVYKLVIAKGGSRLRKSKGPEARDQNCTLPKCMGFSDTDMWNFAAVLTDRMGRPVLDLTGLRDTYDFTLRLGSVEGVPNDDPDLKSKAGNSDWTESSIFGDIEKQLGLKLESDRAPVETLVIDHVERPSEN